MKWKKRKAEIAILRKRHPVVSVTRLPDLACPGSANYPSLSSTGISPICSPRSGASQTYSGSSAFVGTPHKQGPMVMFKDELPWAGGKKS